MINWEIRISATRRIFKLFPILESFKILHGFYGVSKTMMPWEIKLMLQLWNFSLLKLSPCFMFSIFSLQLPVVSPSLIVLCVPIFASDFIFIHKKQHWKCFVNRRRKKLLVLSKLQPDFPQRYFFMFNGFGIVNCGRKNTKLCTALYVWRQ